MTHQFSLFGFIAPISSHDYKKWLAVVEAIKNAIEFASNEKDNGHR